MQSVPITTKAAGHCTDFQEGGRRGEEGVLQNHQQNKAVFYILFVIFIFENKVTGGKMQLDGQFAWCPAAVECPEVVSLTPIHGKVYLIQHYVIKLFSDLRQVSGFHRVLRFPPPIKLTATI